MFTQLLTNRYSVNISESNSARAIGQGGVPVLLNTFYDWHRADSKNRHINLRKSILSVLKNVTNLSKYKIVSISDRVISVLRCYL